MGKFGYYKIESEIKQITKIGGEEFDFTDSWIIKIEPEIYEDDFKDLLLEFGRPINEIKDADDFIIWLHTEKKFETDYVEFNFIANYTDLKIIKEKNVKMNVQ